MPIIPILFLILLFNYPENAQAIRDTSTERLQNYVIHVRQPEGRVFENSDDLRSWHESFLPPSRTDSLRGERILYSYQNVISGFAARLTEEEVRAVEKKNGFVSAQAERVFHPLTTHSPEFLGLNQNTGFWNDSNFGKGVIIGVLDTGIFPTHPSFSDTGVSPPPAKWKGRCDFNASVCNNKLIGARTFNLASMARRGEGKAAEPPLDNDGHGTHTASTAAGAFVQNAGALGNAEGTAVGMAPYAHLASYKVCFEDCPESDILAALDAAVYDGVDVISMSIGGGSLPFFNDSIAIGSFAAVQKGIFVSCAAGNGGPFNSTLSNEAPWILTVGASTINRKIVAAARLGDGEEFDGESLFQPKNFPSTLLPLVYAGMNSSKPESALCGEGALKGLDVKGKVVLCDRGGGIARLAKGQEVKNAGGAAMILANDEADGYSTIADVHVLPAAHVSFAAGQKIKAYINSTHTPTATILFKGTSIGDTLSPVVASFSSRGPNLASPGILKPDIIGPGVSILAAWPFSLDNSTSSKLTFNFESGTSMACPHLSGIAALLKSSHPDWSPAAIKSALMTSANIVNSEGNPIVDQTLQPADIFATGSGHVDPSKASEPGLIYDIQPDDYIPYLCGLGYKDHEVSIIAHRTISCNTTPSIPEGELNYPSFSVKLGSSQTFSRTVTNVGHAKSSYIVTIMSPPGVEVTVNPPTLYFSEVNQKATYSVTFTRSSQGGSVGTFAQGYITWNFAKNSVRSPISVTFE